jgi:ADP-ribose pyrophosphatase YjhB (NUDIX family)
MVIENSFLDGAGTLVRAVYHDADTLQGFAPQDVAGVHAFCFCEGKLVMVHAPSKFRPWSPPGGGVEPGETVEQAVAREVREEGNMRVLFQQLVGVQELWRGDGPRKIQTRSFAVVEPYGPFVRDPDGDVTDILLIEPADFGRYCDWGHAGERALARSLALLAARSA